MLSLHHYCCNYKAHRRREQHTKVPNKDGIPTGSNLCFGGYVKSQENTRAVYKMPNREWNFNMIYRVPSRHQRRWHPWDKTTRLYPDGEA